MSEAGDHPILGVTLRVMYASIVIFVNTQRVQFPSQIPPERNPANEYDSHAEEGRDEIHTHGLSSVYGRSIESARR